MTVCVLLGKGLGKAYDFDTSVGHYAFPHTLAGSAPLQDRVVNLHVYLTWRERHGKFYAKGFGFTEVVAERRFAGSQAGQPEAAQQNPPQLVFETVDNVTIRIEQTAWTEPSRPFTLLHTFDRAPGLLKLKLEGTSLFHYVDHDPLYYYAPQDKSHCVTTLLNALQPRTEPRVALAALLFHVHYHLRLGVHLTVMYTTPEFLPTLLASREVRALLASNNLQFLLWEDFPEIENRIEGSETTFWGSYFSQNLQYNHGLLWNWGRGCYVAVIDLDEYITFNGMHSQSLGSALQSLSSNFSRLHMFRHNVVCSTCVTGETQSEQQYWFGRRHDAHPIELYEVNASGASLHLQGKHIVHPSYVYAWNVHVGRDMPGSPPAVEGDGTIWLRHVINLFTDRQGKGLV